MPIGPEPAGVIRRFGSILGAGPSNNPPGREKTNRRGEAGADAAVGALIAVEEVRDALGCAATTGGFEGIETVGNGAFNSMGRACGRSSGMAISNPASPHWKVMEPSVAQRSVPVTASPRDSMRDPSNIRHLRRSSVRICEECVLTPLTPEAPQRFPREIGAG
jgi:hypothetical protein